MRIQELLESVEDKNHNGINDKLEFDLIDDLFFYMNNDDDIYRRHVYPAVHQFKQARRSGNSIQQNLFGDAVTKAYESYCKKFPLRELPTELPQDISEKVCENFVEALEKEEE